MFLMLPKHKDCHPGKYSPTRFGATMRTNSSTEDFVLCVYDGRAEFFTTRHMEARTRVPLRGTRTYFNIHVAFRLPRSAFSGVIGID